MSKIHAEVQMYYKPTSITDAPHGIHQTPSQCFKAQ